ncbi:MAG TPA: GNAT family N-acetyltransferase [Candidatus Pacearchaeota archaeon]|nr:GNAT family N-acetyltransferase [Candidatus Pacearchaeota archaeon]
MSDLLTQEIGDQGLGTSSKTMLIVCKSKSEIIANINDLKEFINLIDKEKINTKIITLERIMNSECLIFEKKGRIIDLVGVERNRIKLPYIYIVVEKSVQGRGVGKKLLKYLIEFYKKEKKAMVLCAQIRKTNNISLSLHERIGFEKISEINYIYEFMIPLSRKGKYFIKIYKYLIRHIVKLAIHYRL